MQKYHEAGFFEGRAGRFENLVAFMIYAALPGSHCFMRVNVTARPLKGLNRPVSEFAGRVAARLRNQQKQRNESSGEIAHWPAP